MREPSSEVMVIVLPSADERTRFSIEGNLLDVGGKVKIPVSREKKEEIVRAVFGV